MKAEMIKSQIPTSRMNPSPPSTERMEWGRYLALAIVMLVAITALARDNLSIDDLNKSYAGKSAMLRGFYCGSRLEFTAEGKTLVVPDAGAWTECGFIQIKKFTDKKDKLEIEGTRTGITFDDHGKFVPIAGATVKINIRKEPGMASDPTRALDEIFYGKETKLIDVVPDHWKCYVEHPGLTHEELRTRCSRQKLNDEIIQKVKAGVVNPPSPKYDPDPDYTQFARMEHWQGTTLLSVDVSSSGDIENVFVVRPLGLGLDDAAVNAVKKWKFNPAHLVSDHSPVPVSMTIEVNFHMSSQPLRFPGGPPY
jgi:TonB family protein